MILGIDHVVILVNDLDAAVQDYTSLGLTVVPGGEHTASNSHNALIAFEDGSYLELIAFRGPVPKDNLFYRENQQEGLVTYALLPSDIEADIEAARSRGLQYEGPRPGGRLRPDGKRIEWRIAKPPTRDLPFLCGDVTPREWRVPGSEAHKHKNGVVGILGLHVQASDPDATVDRYSALLGAEPFEVEASSGRAAFRIGDAVVNIAPIPNDGEGGDHISTLRLRARPQIGRDLLNRDLAHGADISIHDMPVKVQSIAEEYEYIATLRCASCGGMYKPIRQTLLTGSGGPMDGIDLVCANCGEPGSLLFDISEFFGK